MIKFVPTRIAFVSFATFLLLLLSASCLIAASDDDDEQGRRHHHDPTHCKSLNFLPYHDLCHTLPHVCSSMLAPIVCIHGDGSTTCSTVADAPFKTDCAQCIDLRLCAATSCSPACDPLTCAKSVSCTDPDYPYLASGGALGVARKQCGTLAMMLNQTLISACCLYVNQNSCLTEASSCSEDCGAEFCANASQQHYACPGFNQPADYRYIVTAGKEFGWCGMEQSMWDPTCPNKVNCLIENPGVTSCCNFASCQRTTCQNVACPTSTCYPTVQPPPALCNIIAPFMCLSGANKGGCSTNATLWTHPTLCTSCCDVSSCTTQCTPCTAQEQQQYCVGSCKGTGFVCTGSQLPPPNPVGGCNPVNNSWAMFPYCNQCCSCAP